MTQLDLFESLTGQETAKRAIEIALVGGHAIRFAPTAVGPYGWYMSDVAKLPAASRARALAHMARLGDPSGMAAAMDAVGDCRAAVAFLATMCNLVAPGLDNRAAPIVVHVAPISLADLILPPPVEPGGTVAERITAARARLSLMDEGLDHQALALERQWRDATGASDAEAEAARKVARSITALAYHTKGPAITRLAYAEALSYFARYDPAADVAAVHLNAPELGAVLAGLRTWQAMSDGAPPEVADIADGGGEFSALDDDEIDALAERINA